MSIKWEGVTAIATSATVLAVLGAEMIKMLLEKPKVELLGAKAIGWSLSSESVFTLDGQIVPKPNGAQITFQLKVKNNGSEHTVIDGDFITTDGKIFTGEDIFELEGHGKTKEDFMTLHLPLEMRVPETGKSLHGVLRLKPWHNRRFFIGKKWLNIELDVPDNNRGAK